MDRTTQYNWTFGLHNLSSASILSALQKFRASAGSFAQSFYSDRDLKLFRMAVQEYLINGSSKILPAPAGHQLSSGLVESHWKVMVQMTCAYLTKNQMPRTYWFFAITHATCMMNAIPCKVHGILPHLFFLFMGSDTTSALGFLSFLIASFITTRMVL